MAAPTLRTALRVAAGPVCARTLAPLLRYASLRPALPTTRNSVSAIYARGVTHASTEERIRPPPHLDPAYDASRAEAKKYFDSHGFDPEGRIEWPVEWGSMDICRHTNNVIYVRYVETSRMRWFETLEPDLGAEYCRNIQLGLDTGMVANEQTIKYIRPVVYPDSIIWAVRIHSIDQPKSSYRMAHAGWSVKEGRIVCVADVKGTVFDFNANKRGVMTDDVKAVLESRMRPITAPPRSSATPPAR